MREVLEYLFFTQEISHRFIDELKKRGLKEGHHWVQGIESIHEGLLIKVLETTDLNNWDELWDELDDLFDELTIQDQALLETGEGNIEKSTAGVYIQLNDGSQTIASVKPDVLNRILDVLSNDEFAEFVDTIAKSVESPDNTAICKR
jgi:hypothetical protein